MLRAALGAPLWFHQRVSVQLMLSDSVDLEEMEKLRKEHIEALKDIKRLQVRFHEQTL